MRIRALDSIRGLLLVQMILDHFGNPFTTYLYQVFGFFSAAEGFFFLSGFVGILAARSKTNRGETLAWMPRRAFKIWRIHLFTLFSILAVAFLVFPSLLPYFKAYSSHPAAAIFLSVVLIHIPPWFDILPLYVFLLMAGFFVFPLLVRKHFLIVALGSLGLWALAQWGLRDLLLLFLPEYVYPGFFDLMAWQLVYFAGAISAAILHYVLNAAPSKEKFLNRMGFVSIAVSVFFCLWKYQVIPVPLPSDFWVSREHLGALRFLNFCAFAAGISLAVRKRPQWLDFSFTAILGKNSLIVYALHTFLIYAWFISPPALRFALPWNILIPVLSVVLLWGISLMMEKQKQKF
ncbi:MAG: OpgC domain-containing protein [Fibrobacter sp.]|jgi:hypothetical protein|nr:OpgC domain-containing protein [Fibrobacter sp.]